MFIIIALVAGTLALDATVRPRPGSVRLHIFRSPQGIFMQACVTLTTFGMALAICGNTGVSAAIALALVALLCVASNAKNAMLGEPLLFSDLALIGAVFRHPQFYLSAVSLWQRIAAAIAAAVLLVVLAMLFFPDPVSHLAGLGISAASLGVLFAFLRLVPPAHLAPEPAAADDVRRHGLIPVLLLYWLRWRESRDPQPHYQASPVRPPHDGEVAVIVQCESFGDPADLFAQPALALPGLEAARAQAWQSGSLHVSGFGAYTMRTEYGVLFGRSEEELGFRRYDPFLTALGEDSYGLPNRLKAAGWRSLFLHPHDMRFYGRDRIMPAGGFAELVGEDRFAPPRPGEGRYVTDAAIADVISGLAQDTTAPTMLYAVTIENHGPWAPDRQGGSGALTDSYMALARNSDAMLARLIAELKALGRPAMLVFFGDHRPSIPGVTAPGAVRHTPYVIIRTDAEGNPLRGRQGPVDLTPAELHHTVLEVLIGKSPPKDPVG